jgi:ABC-type lipoprotein release transport system permease subunit
VGAVSAVAASHLRCNRRSSALIVVLLALSAALVLAALAGARRTDAAIRSFVAADKGADGYLAFASPSQGGTASPDLAREQSAVEAFDGVTHTARFSDATVALSGPSIPSGPLLVRGFVGIDADGISMIGRLHVVDGRSPDQTRAGDVVIDEELARDADLAVGSRVVMRAYTAEQLSAGPEVPAAGVEVDAEIVGIVRRPTDLRDPQSRQPLPPNDYIAHQQVYLTTALWDAARGDMLAFTPRMIGVDVADGARVGDVLAAISKETRAYPIVHSRFLDLDGTFHGVDRSISLHSRGLQVFAGVLAIAGLFLVGQTIGRQIFLEGLDNDTLRAVGMTPRQLRLAALLRAAPVAAAGAFLGALGAIALSPLAPLPGTVARRAELQPGVSVDAFVLVAGGLLAAVLATLAAALPSARSVSSTTGDASARHRPTVASRLAARGMPAPAVVGVRFALEPGRGRTAVPVRTAIATAATAVAVVVAAVAFSSSLAESRGDSRRFGVTWDVVGGAMFDPEEAAARGDDVRGIPGVVAFAGMATTAFDTTVGEIPSVMLRQEQGRVTPLITEGRAPARGEVALGALTMREHKLLIGDRLEIDDAIAGKPTSFEVTGVVVLNVAGIDVSIAPGRGALFDWSVLGLMNPEADKFVAPQIYLVDVEPGRTRAVEARLRTIFPTSTSAAPVEPLDLTNLGDASLLPSALGAVVGLLGIGTVAHAMLSAVRRRQRELAVLKAIGFVRSDTRRAVVWQALTFVLVALAVGLPVGVLAGRAAWSIAAHGLGIPSHPVVGAASMAVIATGFLLLLVLAAAVPAQLAGRVPAATVLRRD